MPPPYPTQSLSFISLVPAARQVPGKVRPSLEYRVLAGNEPEKSKNGPLALASERRRRVESAPSPMKKDPNQNSTDSAEIEALINRHERGQLRDEEGGHE